MRLILVDVWLASVVSRSMRECLACAQWLKKMVSRPSELRCRVLFRLIDSRTGAFFGNSLLSREASLEKEPTGAYRWVVACYERLATGARQQPCAALLQVPRFPQKDAGGRSTLLPDSHLFFTLYPLSTR